MRVRFDNAWRPRLSIIIFNQADDACADNKSARIA